MFRQEVVVGSMIGEAAGAADQLDLEAAEQLIQLSGGDGADDDGGSESRSADSVKCREADQDQAGVKKEKETAVESRPRRFAAGNKAGDGGEFDRRSADSVSSKCSGRAAGAEEKGLTLKVEDPAAVDSRRRSAARFPAAVVDDGEERRRPRFRWLADVYRETRQQLTARDLHVIGVDDHDHEADDRKKMRKRAAEADDENVLVPVVSKESKKRTMAAYIYS